MPKRTKAPVPPEPKPPQATRASGPNNLLTPQEYGRLFAQARIAAGIPTRYAAAKKLGVSMPNIYALERGERIPSWPTLHRYAVALGLDLAILFPGVPKAG